ncbi:MAG: DUF4105 domain-containing protein [Sulfurovum sp.]|nr:DUF4105 domain-containing protein [Sulfurovum sp.]
MQRSLFFLLFFVSLLYSSKEETESLVQKLKLYENNEWKALLHYNNGFKVTDKKFLLSKNPSLKNELVATTKAFYDLPSHFQNINEHAQCKFPARLLFITHELNISNNEFPKINCQDFQIYKQKAPTDEIALVYASENVKNLSSMMGHVFLKFSGNNDKNLQVNHTITFYTVIESVNPFSLIYQNTVSGMKGLFALKPYRAFKENYTKKENRNLWEYQLSLNDYRRKLIYYHVWELENIDMKYYFTSYNCSTVIYNMLSLAKPKIYNDKKIWITPLDSVKYLYKYNLIKKVQLYPSSSWLTKILEDTNMDVNDVEQLQNKIIDISKYKSPNKIPGERQLSAGYVNLNQEKYLKLSFLPASHLLNGYNREYCGKSELKIASLSVLVNDKNIELEDFTLYEMKSYMPYSSLIHDLSYQFELAVKKEYTKDENYNDTLKINGGVGIDFLFFNNINIFTMLNGGIGYNKDDNIHLLFNPQIGMMIYELFNMKSLFYYQPYFINDEHIYNKYVIEHNIFIHKNYTLYFNLEKIDKHNNFLNYDFGLKYLF